MNTRALRPASPAGVLDALSYPFRGAALAALLGLTVLRIPASGLPWFAPLFHLLLWLAVFKYALEALARSGHGDARPPEILGAIDISVHRRHVLVQLTILILLSGVVLFAPQWLALTVVACALILPGLILALTVSQNITAALNPANWWVVASKLGVGYPALVGAWTALLLLMVHGTLWTGWLPKLLGMLAFYLVTQFCTLALFRWMGVFLAAHADALGLEKETHRKPELARERDLKIRSRDVREALAIADPGARARALSETIAHGSDDSAHEPYRQALRAAGARDKLHAHARQRTSQLVMLQRGKEAIALAREAIEDDPRFTLSAGDEIEALIALAGPLAQWRLACRIVTNYRAAHPRRRDGWLLAASAAILQADRLREPESAAASLAGALKDCNDNDIAVELKRLQQRLEARLPLGSFAGTPDEPPA